MAEEREVEVVAREQGWKPESEWHGDPPKGGFKSAEQFVKDGESITPILNSKVERLEARVEQLLNSNKQVNEWAQKSKEKDKREREKLIGELEEARAQAITDGDGQAAVKAERDINDLRQEPEVTQPQLDPVAQEWLNDNSWYTADETLGAFADGISERLVAQGYSGKAYYEELTRRTQKAFPSKFSNENRQQPASVEDGGEIARDSEEHTWGNLPKEAKDAFKQFAQDIPGYTKEQYLENYEWE